MTPGPISAIDGGLHAQRRRLGRSDLRVYPLAFGGNVFGWTVDAATSHSLLDAFIDRGGNLIDTADVYSAWLPGNSGGESERIIGDWIANGGRRDGVLIATKVGLHYAPGTARQHHKRKPLTRATLERGVEASLRRLRTDYIDLYQSHFEDPSTPIEETLTAYESLVQRGLVRTIGASNYGAPTLTTALHTSDKRGLPRYESLQTLYNLHDRTDFEDAMLPLCQAEDIGVLTYFSLASGFLTGKYRSHEDLKSSLRGDGLGKYMTPRGFRILDALDAAAQHMGVTPAQVALSWVLARPGVTAALCSATSLSQLSQLFAACDIELDAQCLKALDLASQT